jgi:hypothetical protein
MPPTLLARADEMIERSGADLSRCSAARRQRGRSRRVRSNLRSGPRVTEILCVHSPEEAGFVEARRSQA